MDLARVPEDVAAEQEVAPVVSIASAGASHRVSAVAATSAVPVTSAASAGLAYRPVSGSLAIAPSVGVVIPVKNEARNLPLVLKSVPEWVDEVVLVDGHSVDDTVAVARACWPGITVVTQPGRGKGDALLAGFEACTSDIIVMMDGDGSTPGGEIVRFVAALVAGADFAKGSRFASSGGSDDITLGRRLGNWALSGLVNLAFGTQYTDLCYGYNAFWAKHLPALDLDCDGFEVETVMNIRAAKAGLWVQEIPSQERPRVHGESNLHIVVDGWRILKAITAETLRGPVRPVRRPAAVHGIRGGQAAVPSRISVVICAHTMKRWNETLAAVDSVRNQSFRAEEIIVVVDHNPELYAALRAELPDLTVVENQQERGLSGGKNTGVALARGEVVAFLDDDAVADSDWLKFFADSYADPQVIGVGGLTLPNWAAPRPSWFPREFDWVVGCTYRGMPETRSPVRNLLGGNASFRREAFELAGGFQNGIGRSAGKRPLGCEETEFCIRVTQNSPESVFLFDNRAVISHLVPAERCRFAYFRARCYAEGLSKALVTASVGTGDGLASERRYTTRTLPGGVIHGVADAVRGDSSGLGRAGAIVAGLAATAAGYTAGTASRRMRAARRSGMKRLPAAAAAALGPAGRGQR
jgi:glucosyl-dolichyl phosphate glucuronosyltransferase